MTVLAQLLALSHACGLTVLLGHPSLTSEDEFHIIVRNTNVAAVEFSVRYQNGWSAPSLSIPTNSVKTITVPWQDRPFFVVVQLQEDGLFDARGGGIPRRTTYYTDLLTAEVGERMTLEIPRNIGSDARFRREPPAA